MKQRFELISPRGPGPLLGRSKLTGRPLIPPFVKSRLCALSLLVASVLLSGCATGGLGRVPLGNQAPFATITLLDGSTHTIPEYRGKHLVLAFWAQWCTKSGPLMAELSEYARTLGHRRDLEVLAVSVDKNEDFEKLRERIVYQHLDGVTHAFSGNAEYDDAYMRYGTGEIPLIIVINPRGVVAAQGASVDVVREYFGEG